MKCTVDADKDYYHIGDHSSAAASAGECCAQCYADAGCIYYT